MANDRALEGLAIVHMMCSSAAIAVAVVIVSVFVFCKRSPMTSFALISAPSFARCCKVLSAKSSRCQEDDESTS